MTTAGSSERRVPVMDLHSPHLAPVPIKNRRVWRDLARILSTIFNPFLTALALFMILSHILARTTQEFWWMLFLSTAFTSIVPMLFIFWLYATDRISDLDMSVREEREKVFGIFVICYLLGTITLWLTHSPRLLIATMAGYHGIDDHRAIHHALLENQHARARDNGSARRAVFTLRRAASSVLAADSGRLLGTRISESPYDRTGDRRSSPRRGERHALFVSLPRQNDDMVKYTTLKGSARCRRSRRRIRAHPARERSVRIAARQMRPHRPARQQSSSPARAPLRGQNLIIAHQHNALDEPLRDGEHQLTDTPGRKRIACDASRFRIDRVLRLPTRA